MISLHERAPRARSTGRVALYVAVATALAGCYEQTTAPDTETDGRITVTNDEAALAQRLRYTDETVPIDAPAPGAFGAATSPPALAPRSVRLSLIAEIAAPEVNGETLQATSVSRRSTNSFLVSYAFIGEPAQGALDYVVNWRGRLPRLGSSATFVDSDVYAVALGEGVAYAGSATLDATFTTPASVERLMVEGSGLQIAGGLRGDLGSFAATSVAPVGSVLYVTTGDAGGLYALNESDLSVLAHTPMDDARWVEYDEAGDRLVVLQGQPGRLSVVEAGNFAGGELNVQATYPFPGADVPESKSALDIAGGKAFVAAGPEGVQVVCLDDGQIVGTVPRPDPASLGLDPSVVVTNAVTVSEDLMFVSNGEAGVYVAAGDEAWEDTACNVTQSIRVMGRLRFDDLQSANHVDYRQRYLLVAAGLGGLKIVEADIRY